VTSLDVVATRELSEINDLITRLCSSFPSVPRPTVFHLVRQQYEKHDATPRETSLCSIIEPTCREELAREWPARVA